MVNLMAKNKVLDTQLTLNKYLLNEWINQWIDENKTILSKDRSGKSINRRKRKRRGVLYNQEALRVIRPRKRK